MSAPQEPNMPRSNDHGGDDASLVAKAQGFAKDLAVGGTAGAVSKTLMSPIERVKILEQINKTHPDVLAGKVPRFEGPWDCARQVYAKQGVRAFWRGNVVNCMRYAPQQGSALAFNDAINDAFPQYDAKTQFWQSMGVKLASGGIAGAMSNTICYPFDFARTRLAGDVGAGGGQFKGIGDCIMTTVRSQGVVGLYTGWSVTVAGAFVYRAGQLGLFKQIQGLNPYKDDSGTLGVASAFVAVSAARTAVLPFNYPFDTVRRRLMMQSEKPLEERVFKGSVDCVKQILKNEGARGLYSGIAPEVLRGVGGSLAVVAYDRIQHYLRTQRQAQLAAQQQP